MKFKNWVEIATGESTNHTQLNSVLPIVEDKKNRIALLLLPEHDKDYIDFNTDSVIVEMDNEFYEKILSAKRTEPTERVLKFVNKKWQQMQIALKHILLEC